MQGVTEQLFTSSAFSILLTEDRTIVNIGMDYNSNSSMAEKLAKKIL